MLRLRRALDDEPRRFRTKRAKRKLFPPRIPAPFPAFPALKKDSGALQGNAILR
jgi:hypothetical protein